MIAAYDIAFADVLVTANVDVVADASANASANAP